MRGSWIGYTLVGVLLATATAAFLYPVRGARGPIHAAKRRALAEVRHEIREDRARMADGAAAGQRLPALLAWEARVEGVSEGPFDTGTLARFGLLLPLLSWLGGALVERAVDALLSP